MHNRFTASLIVILPLVLSFILGGVLSWYGDHAELTSEFCMALYIAGIIIGILTLSAMYRMTTLTAQNADDQPVCIGKRANILRLFLFAVLLICIAAFGYVLMTNYSQFFAGTYSIYTFGVVFGLLFNGLTFEFNAACGELQKFFGKRS
ncbi:hypothetical protein [Methanorbis rubei]|uniref:Uncharacterized protein n=1 Tax=Methanorbis rubei TaxID=3028300 RepID=A0AAE4MGC2_9EURY|nr:hypothetical protein [Methanocorpusculaceae archaeon Cs1]